MVQSQILVYLLIPLILVPSQILVLPLIPLILVQKRHKNRLMSCVYYLMSKNQKGVLNDSLLVFIRTMLYPPELLNFRFQEPYRSTP